MTATNGYELSAGNEIELDLINAGGTVAFSVFYLDAAANGNKYNKSTGRMVRIRP